MKPRNTLILVALFALMFGYVYFVEQNKTPEQLGTPVPTALPRFFSVTAGDVKTIEVRDLRAPRTVQLSRTYSDWQVVQPIAKPADTPTVDSVLSQIANLSASRVLTNVTDIAPFGFVTATLEVRLIMSDTTTYALTVGDKTPDGFNYYAVYTGDKSKVFVISTSTIDTINDWLATPPYQPTATPTATATLPPTPTIAVTETVTSTETITATPTVSSSNPTVAPPNLVPTVAIPAPAGTATPK